MNGWFETTTVAQDVHAILEPAHWEQVISYLIIGNETAVLLDTGMGIADMHSLVSGLTNLPVTVVNTHYHWDHIGDNDRFDHISIHEAEASLLEREAPEELLREAMRPENFWAAPPPDFDPSRYHILPSKADRLLGEGDMLDLGGRRLQVLHTPGHSPGSICLLTEDGLLFTGDTVYAGPLYVQFEDSDLGAYHESMQRLGGLASSLELVLPGHNRTPLEPDILVEMAEGFELIASSAAPYRVMDSAWGPLRQYEFREFSVLLPLHA